jgi:hypothetical protein
MTEENEVTSQECALCLSDIDEGDEFNTSDGQIACADCVRICDRCNDTGTMHDSFIEVDGRYLWCEGCCDYNAYYCENCCEWNSESSVYIRDEQENWCDSCTSDNAIYCDDCDNYYAHGCEDCVDERIIHDYSYRPDAIFHSTDKNERLFFGLELEVEVESNYDASSRYAQEHLEPIDLAYLKSDGSLNHGYEIVTHPMSHAFFKNEAQELWDTLEHLRTSPSVRVKAWDTRTCGLHIHISRTGFSGGAHMHRFLNLVYSNQLLYEALAGRKSDRWASFDDIKQLEYERDQYGNRVYDDYGHINTKQIRNFKSKIFEGRHTNRYSAVNTQNRETLEMRIFRGTVNPSTIKSQLDLAHASVEYTRNLSVKDVINGAMQQQAFADYIMSNPELYSDLISRMSRIESLVGLTRQNVSN